MIKRAIIAAFIVALSVWAWRCLDFIPIDVIGQPASTGFVQSRIEAPFFQRLAQDTGLPLRVRYRPLEMVGYKDTHQLAILNEGKADLISLRFAQNSAVMPELVGVELGGLNVDLKQGRSLVDAYSPVIDQKLQERFDSKLLSIWPFGPQVMFCRKSINFLRDIAGLKIRIAGSLLEPVISALDAIPVVVAFEDVAEGLRLGIFDCAISSSASANFAGWPKYSTHYYPITLQLGLILKDPRPDSRRVSSGLLL
jgi:TRAP-type C4-dicarboxylate transport system substrate-binding protein